MRKSGILLHISSLPSDYGIGKMGSAAYAFADFLVDAGVQVWQILPLSPTSYGDSPYQSFSVYAGNQEANAPAQPSAHRDPRERGFNKTESLWKGRDGVWGREGKAFLQKSFPSLPQYF